MDFGQRIKEERIKFGFSQQEVAEALFVTRQTVSKWELGKSYPNLELLADLSELYELSLDELLKEDKKLVHFMQDNPRATKSQKTARLLISMIASLFFIIWSAVSLSYSYNKFSGFDKVALPVSEIVFVTFLILNIGQLVKLNLKKENPKTRSKKLALAAHSMENKRIFTGSIGVVTGMIGLVCLHYNNWKLACGLILVEMLMGIGFFFYSYKIRQNSISPTKTAMRKERMPHASRRTFKRHL